MGGVTPLLLGQYVIASQAVHHAPRDLERRYIVEDESLVGISLGLSLDMEKNYYLIRINWFLLLCNGLQSQLVWKLQGRLMSFISAIPRHTKIWPCVSWAEHDLSVQAPTEFELSSS